jgi:hypothetical protein
MPLKDNSTPCLCLTVLRGNPLRDLASGLGHSVVKVGEVMYEHGQQLQLLTTVLVTPVEKWI